jgi:predicted HTH transcriptional regulator
MEYSNIYFNKSLDDLTYQDIEDFFVENKEEGETIEFKSFHQQSTFDSNIGNVIKGISAFLNSNGGLLIWGAPVGKNLENRKEQIFVGALAPVNILKEKDALINLISNRITPLPIGIKVKILEKENQYLYIFDVQQSLYKPHQYNDRYYVRLDGQSKPAPHYLIEALVKRISYPDVNGFIKFEKLFYSETRYVLNFSVFLVNFSKLQNEENAAFQLVLFPGKILNKGQHIWGEFYSEEYKVLHFGRPVRQNFDVAISEEDLAKFNYKLKISISFGGKYSPAKSSNYTIQLKPKQATEQDKNANDLIIKLEENVLFSDHQEKLGKSKDSFVKDVLGRD